jgi:two-component system, chemotaxis family, sensor kinase CheA
VHRLRGQLLPLVFLDQVFGAPQTDHDGPINIVVLQADDSQFGLVIDDISDTAEIVVKPLGRLLKNAAGFAGATIMGDGRVALILDVAGLAQHAGMGATARNRQDQTARGDDRSAGIESILVVGLGERRFALPLANVARLEEIPEASVRSAGDQQVVHYRGQILPLVRLTDKLGIASEASSTGTLQVLVCGSEERSVGLIVDAIYDVVEDRLLLSERTTSFGVRGTVVLHGEVTDILDLGAILGEDVVLPVFTSEVAA